MWPLLLLSLLGFTIFMERTLFLHRGQIRSNSFLEGIKNLVRKQRLLEALTVCEETPGPVASIVKAGLLNCERQEDDLRASMREAALVEIPLLERRIGTLGAIAKIAPLVGLLGTVIAVLQGFHLMQATDSYADAAQFSAVVAKALITTATGLAIAIMAYLAYHFLHGRVRALIHDMEWVANDMLQFILRDLPEHPTGDDSNPEPPHREDQ